MKNRVARLLVVTVVTGLMAVPAQASPLPIVRLSVSHHAAEPAEHGELVLVREGDASAELVVGLEVTDQLGAATPGVDYEPLPDEVVIPAGRDRVTVPVTVLDDAVTESNDEGLEVAASDGEGYYVDRTSSGQPQHTVRIADDDLPGVAADIRLYALEYAPTGTFRFFRIGDLRQSIEVDYRVGGDATPGADYVEMAGTVTMPAGEEVVDLPVSILQDELLEGVETIALTVQDRAGSYAATAGKRTALLELRDDENPVLERLAGSTRIQTAVEVARRSHPDGADAVLLARADVPSDALAAGPLAAQLDAPILLTDSDELHPDTAQEIDRLGATRAVLLGGQAALSSRVEAAAGSQRSVTDVSRIAGRSRFETAAAVARQIGSRRVYVVASSAADPMVGWADAVGVSALAAFQRRAILLVEPGGLPVATRSVLIELDVDHVTIVGGSAVVPLAVGDELADYNADGTLDATREYLTGANRLATSQQIVRASVAAGMDPALIWVASMQHWPDALVAGPAAAREGGLLALIDGREPTSISSTPLAGTVNELVGLRLLGGPSAIKPDVEARLADDTNREEPPPVFPDEQ